MDCLLVSVFEYKGSNALHIDFCGNVTGFFNNASSSSDPDAVLNMSQICPHGRV